MQNLFQHLSGQNFVVLYRPPLFYESLSTYGGGIWGESKKAFFIELLLLSFLHVLAVLGVIAVFSRIPFKHCTGRCKKP